MGYNEAPYDGDNTDSNRLLKLEKLYVDPSATGQGIGTALLRHMLQESGDSFDAVWLMVLRTNTTAVALYERQGFVTFDTSPGKFKEEDGSVDEEGLEVKTTSNAIEMDVKECHVEGRQAIQRLTVWPPRISMLKS